MIKRYKTRAKVMKFEEKAQNFYKNIQKYEMKHCFAVAQKNLKHFFSYFFQFHETIETWRNSDLFRTVLFFVKLKKYQKLSSLVVGVGLHGCRGMG